MKKQIAVTIVGEARSGKSSVAIILEAALSEGHKVEVVNEDDGRDRAGAGTVRLSEDCVVTIRTRITPKVIDGALSDQDCLLKIKEVRDYVNGLSDNVGNTRAHGEALALLDDLADEIEDRLSKAHGATGA